MQTEDKNEKKSKIVMTSLLLAMSAAANAALPATQAAETLTWKGLVPFSVLPAMILLLLVTWVGPSVQVFECKN